VGSYPAAVAEGASLDEHRSRRVEDAFASLPERYLGADPEFSATYRVELEDVHRSWIVELDAESCQVFDRARGEVNVVIGTDAATWLALREGRLSGLDAFRSRRLWARGNLDLAVAFEGFFALPNGRDPLLRVHEVPAGKARISSLTAGDGPQVAILIHGLGGNKTSFFETVSALSPDFTVHAIDLPGFGSSSKPTRAPYDAAWFSRSVLRFMDELEIDKAHLVGNSMGGRVALELGLTSPSRVLSLSLLAPSMAWRRHRELVPIVRLLRPELAAIPHSMLPRMVKRQFWSMFSQPDRLHPTVADVAVEEFLRTYRTKEARIAFHASARNIYLEEPFGPNGFWTRLPELKPPAMFVWGDSDPLVPDAFARHVAEALPNSRSVILPECGHVPQVELPEVANGLVRDFITQAARSPTARAAAMLRRAGRRVSRNELWGRTQIERPRDEAAGTAQPRA
jgi:pimeloyl-ACP methyl ester carboxylesterase